jgi:L-lactate dehydrogenase complex protein LldG
MNTREKILDALKQNVNGETIPLPEIRMEDTIRYDNLSAQFATVLSGIGGFVMEFKSQDEVLRHIEQNSKTGELVFNTYAISQDLREKLMRMNAHELEQVERAYLPGLCAVAENGAVWVSESGMINRLLPFICQHLVLVVEKKNLVANMHAAFEHPNTEINGFGSFIAGPSKTADIEQCLVIGAHGARSLTVYLVG